MGANTSSKNSVGSGTSNNSSSTDISSDLESSNDFSMTDLFNLNVCIVQIERKLDDVELDATLNNALVNPEMKRKFHNSCKDEKRELNKRLDLLKERQQKVFKSYSKPKKFEKRTSPVTIIYKKKEKLQKKTSTQIFHHSQCRSLHSLEDAYLKFTTTQTQLSAC